MVIYCFFKKLNNRKKYTKYLPRSRFLVLTKKDRGLWGRKCIRAFRGACECRWKYRSISSNSPAQLEVKGTINEVKYGCLLLLVEVFIKVMNDLVMTLEEEEVFMCLTDAILPIREWRCQDIDQVILHEIIFSQCIQKQWNVRQNATIYVETT